RMDFGLGSRLLEAVWRAEFPVLLRHRKHSDRHGPVAGKQPDYFVAVGVTADGANSLFSRSGRRVFVSQTLRWGHGVHGRSGDSFAGTDHGPLPSCCAAPAVMGGETLGIRSASFEDTGSHRVSCHSDLPYVAAGIQRELGARDWARTERDAGLVICDRILG